MAHKHTICHATGSSSNPFVRITPAVSGVFHGHIGHQGDEDIVPPFVYKGATYSQNWDAEGQALFNAGCAAPAAPTQVIPATPSKQEKKDTTTCPATTTVTERVLVGVWHATGSFKNGQRKYVLITPSLKSAHYDSSKHADDKPVYEDRTVTVAAAAASCTAATPPSQNMTPPQGNVSAPLVQPSAPVAAAPTPALGTVAAQPAATSRPAAVVQAKPAGGVLGATASGPIGRRHRDRGNPAVHRHPGVDRRAGRRLPARHGARPPARDLAKHGRDAAATGRPRGPPRSCSNPIPSPGRRSR